MRVKDSVHKYLLLQRYYNYVVNVTYWVSWNSSVWIHFYQSQRNNLERNQCWRWIGLLYNWIGLAHNTIFLLIKVFKKIQFFSYANLTKGINSSKLVFSVISIYFQRSFFSLLPNISLLD